MNVTNPLPVPMPPTFIAATPAVMVARNFATEFAIALSLLRGSGERGGRTLDTAGAGSHKLNLATSTQHPDSPPQPAFGAVAWVRLSNRPRTAHTDAARHGKNKRNKNKRKEADNG